jgi:hypothetical protein
VGYTSRQLSDYRDFWGNHPINPSAAFKCSAGASSNES